MAPRTTSGSKSKTTSSSASRSKTTAKAKPTAKSATSKSGGARRASSPNTESVKRFDGRSVKRPAAFAFLMRQHREVEGWFEQYEKTEDDSEKAELSAKICLALKVHTQIEEELLYPPAHEKVSEEDMVDEAYVEHDSAKQLIAQIEGMKVGDHLYDAKVKVLGEYVKHHVQEEESELFPEIAKTDIDLEAIAPRLEARNAELMEDLSGSSSSGRAARASETGAGARA